MSAHRKGSVTDSEKPQTHLFHTKNSPTSIPSTLHSQKAFLAKQVIITTYILIKNTILIFNEKIPENHGL